ncbi:G-protein beta WD-40 repeats containing protein, partial [Reticulomyxa filosa]
MFLTRDESSLSIDEIRTIFNCHEMESFKDFPKIFIVDVCRSENSPISHQTTTRRTNINNNMPFGYNSFKTLLFLFCVELFLFLSFKYLEYPMDSINYFDHKEDNSSKDYKEKTKKSYKNELKLINQKKEIQIIIHHWIRTFNIRLGWIKDFDKLVVNYVSFYVYSIDYSTFDDCQFICSGSDDGTVRVWDVDNNKQFQSFNGHSKRVNCVKFSSYHYHNNQNVICSSSWDRTIRFWDFKHNKQLQIFKGHTSGVCGIEFSSFNGGRYLCSGLLDKTIRLWDVETYKLLHVFNGHKNIVWCVDISPLQSNNNNDNNKMNNIGVIGGNGYTICSGSFDQTIRIWDIETIKQFN